MNKRLAKKQMTESKRVINVRKDRYLQRIIRQQEFTQLHPEPNTWFKPSDGYGRGSGSEVWNRSGASVEFFDKRTLLENLPSKEVQGGGRFWADFERSRPDWTEEDLETRCWGGGGFHYFPTVEMCERGTVAFITETQFAHLGDEGAQFICSVALLGDGFGDWRELYLQLKDIDFLVVIPDAEIDRIAC